MDLRLGSSPELAFMQPQQASRDHWSLSRGGMLATRLPHISESKAHVEKKGDMPPTKHLKSAKASLASLWPTVAFLVGVSLLLFSLCGGVRRVYSGATVRKLADGGSGEGSGSGGNPFFVEGDWTVLDADELATLCSALGEWAPSAAPQSASTPPLRMPEVASTSRGHRGEHSLQTIRTPGDLFGASSSEQQHQAVGSTQRRRRIFPQGDSDGWEPSPKKSGWLAHGSSVVAGAEGPRSAVHQLPEAVQQTPGSLYAHSPYLWHPSVPATFAPQPGLATPALVLQGAQQAQHIGQLMGQRVTLQPPTIPPAASSAPPTGSSIVSVLSIEDSTQASASQRVSVPATQSGSLALAYAAQSGSLASTSASQSDSLASAGPLSQRDNEASTRRSALMEVVAPGPSAESKSRHPFVRMPTLMPWVRVADVQEEIPDSWTATEAMVYLLRTVRNLCLKPALDLRDTNELVGAAINLARRALISMTTPLVDVKASTAADTLGRRFLVFKAFHTVLKLVGDEKPRLRELWHTLVASIPTAYSNRFTGAYSNKHMFQVELSYQLSAALELYKSGSSPSDDEIIALHRKLFCMKFSPRAFLRDAWDPWRQDDTEYRDGP